MIIDGGLHCSFVILFSLVWLMLHDMHLGTFSYTNSFNQNLASWNVAKVVNMEGTFYDAYSFTGAGLSYWDVSQVTTMYGKTECCVFV